MSPKPKRNGHAGPGTELYAVLEREADGTEGIAVLVINGNPGPMICTQHEIDALEIMRTFAPALALDHGKPARLVRFIEAEQLDAYSPIHLAGKGRPVGNGSRILTES